MSDSFENLLARTERRDGAPAGVCPDAEVLAAYLDATLTPTERADVDAHTADCARCALQLATLVRLEDVSGTPQHAPVRRWWPRLAWMVPAATAVLVGAVYLALPSTFLRSAAPPQRSAAADERAELKEQEAFNPQAPKQFPEQFPEQSEYRLVPPMSTPAPTAKSIPSAAGAPAARTDAAPPGSEPAATERASAANATARDAVVQQRELILPRSEFQRKAEQGQPAAAPPENELRVEARSRARTTSVAQLGAAKLADVQLPLVIRSPEERVQWRVIEDRIQRSTDGGGTWIAERAPAAEAITMGAAPGPGVCWMAGRSGQVLRRNEDGTWIDVSPAPRLAIIRLDVNAPFEAVVTGADGTALKTADGGRTWMH
jgi:Putative zinc-finger